MHFEMSDITEGQLIRLKEQEKPTSTLLYRMAVFSAAIVVSVGACQVQVKECGLESGPPSSKNQSEAAVKQAAEKKWSKCLGLPGVPNLHKVSEHLYRGAERRGYEAVGEIGHQNSHQSAVYSFRPRQD